MTAVLLSRAALETIRHHGESSYPEECCGFLLTAPATNENGAERRIARAEPITNRSEAPRNRRYLIAPDELRRFENSLEGSAESLVGFYHSHPDHPAAPSQFDQEHAWPWYTYLVLAVQAGEAGDFATFELDPDERKFHPVPSRVLGETPLPVKER